MEMGEKKNPRIPPWKVWILVLSVTQAVSVVQNFRSHQLLWDVILRMQQSLNQVLQENIEYHQVQNQYLEELNRILESYYK